MYPKFSTLVTLFFTVFIASAAAGADYSGQFDPALVANTEDFEKIIFKYTTAEQMKGKISFTGEAHFAAGLLIDPKTERPAILALLVEEDGEDPVIFVDSNGDKSLTDEEKYVLKQSKSDNPYLWNTTAQINLKDGPFKTFPLFLQYFRSIKADKMGPDDRMVTQTTEALARGRVLVKETKVTVQYAYDVGSKKVDPQNGWLGVDGDENGEIDMDSLSPEAARADNEAVVFRVGSLYVSTKKADVGKNLIVLRENEAKDFKRDELFMGKDFPEFSFKDFDGKKRSFSEFRGKYVLLDVWGFWCPPCRKELPYLREAHRRFKERNLVLLGLNTDEDYTIDSMKDGLNKAGMNWTHAQFTSVLELLRVRLRISSFPSTFLISPEGKILSMSRSDRDEPDLRGSDLLETLDEILPTP